VFMIAKMSGDDLVSSVSRRSRRSGLLRVENDAQSADVEIISPLDELAQRLRASRNGHFFLLLGSNVDPSYMERLPMCGCKFKPRSSHI